ASARSPRADAVAYSPPSIASPPSLHDALPSAGTLPPGLTLSADGVLRGTPTTAGVYSGEVTASNGTAPDAVQPFTISIAAAAVSSGVTTAAPAARPQRVSCRHPYSTSGTGTIR